MKREVDFRLITVMAFYIIVLLTGLFVDDIHRMLDW